MPHFLIHNMEFEMQFQLFSFFSQVSSQRYTLFRACVACTCIYGYTRLYISLVQNWRNISFYVGVLFLALSHRNTFNCLSKESSALGNSDFILLQNADFMWNKKFCIMWVSTLFHFHYINSISFTPVRRQSRKLQCDFSALPLLFTAWRCV